MNLEDYHQFKAGNVRKTLKETSYDPDNDEYMTHCEKNVICFDSVKRDYLNAVGLSEECAKSVDALFQCVGNDDGDRIFMVEFKNGDVKPIDIVLKIKDSLMIFNSITNKQLEYTRENLTFILVYNEDKHEFNYKDRIAIANANRGKMDFGLFGLSKLRDYCFIKVFALDRRGFDKFISQRL